MPEDRTFLSLADKRIYEYNKGILKFEPLLDGENFIFRNTLYTYRLSTDSFEKDGETVILPVTMGAFYAPKITAGQVLQFEKNSSSSKSVTVQVENVTSGENGVTSVQWSASEYPDGILFDTNTVTFSSDIDPITGTGYATIGDYSVSITVTTHYGTDTQNITIRVTKYNEPE